MDASADIVDDSAEAEMCGGFWSMSVYEYTGFAVTGERNMTVLVIKTDGHVSARRELLDFCHSTP